VNLSSNTQAVQCKYDPNTGGYWDPNPIPCEPVTCKFPAPTAPTGSRVSVLYSPNPSTNKQYQTTIAYICPLNQVLVKKYFFTFILGILTFNFWRGLLQNIFLSGQPGLLDCQIGTIYQSERKIAIAHVHQISTKYSECA
jgi:hypothetical protein